MTVPGTPTPVPGEGVNFPFNPFSALFTVNSGRWLVEFTGNFLTRNPSTLPTEILVDFSVGGVAVSGTDQHYDATSLSMNVNASFSTLIDITSGPTTLAATWSTLGSLTVRIVSWSFFAVRIA